MNTNAKGNARPRVLVVEDELIVAADLERDLAGLGYEVTGVADRGRDAIRMADSTRPELVLMDIMLPGEIDGISAAIEIKERWQIPVVFVTANNNEAVLERAKQADPVAYLTKPFRREELQATLTVALHQSHVWRRLFDEHTWLDTILKSIRDGVIATDAAGYVRYMNPVAEQLTGCMREEASGLPIERVYRMYGVDAELPVRCPLRRALNEGAATAREAYGLESKTRERRYVEDAAAPIFGAGGVLIGAVTVFQDITARRAGERERERLMSELQRSNEDLARFAHSVSHDLQEPLRNIRVLSELLVRRSEGDSSIGHLSQMVVGAADRMQRLITSLLGYASVGEAAIRFEFVNVRDLVESLRRNMSVRFTESGAKLTCGELPTVVADRVGLERVFQNLLANAIQYRSPDRTLELRVEGETQESGWLLSVLDNGIGIRREHLETVFEPLNRLNENQAPGTGLGLAMCRRIVTRHGGRIWAESRGAGEGSTFRIFLPTQTPRRVAEVH